MTSASTSSMAADDGKAADIYRHLLDWAQQHPDLRCHLLIDPALRDAQQLWDEIAPNLRERRTPINIHETLFPPDQRPCFYELDLTLPTDRSVLESSVALALEDWSVDAAPRGEGHRICAWLWMPRETPASDLARHLARQAIWPGISPGKRCNTTLHVTAASCCVTSTRACWTCCGRHSQTNSKRPCSAP